MRFDVSPVATRITDALAVAKMRLPTRLRSWTHKLLEARRRRLEHEKQFYAALNTYCRANNVSPVCEDDWKTRG
jgi:hypothetical protein